MCKAWDVHKKRGIQEGRYLEIYSLVQDGIIEPELGAKLFIVKYKCRKLQTKNVGRCNYIL